MNYGLSGNDVLVASWLWRKTILALPLRLHLSPPVNVNQVVKTKRAKLNNQVKGGEKTWTNKTADKQRKGKGKAFRAAWYHRGDGGSDYKEMEFEGQHFTLPQDSSYSLEDVIDVVMNRFKKSPEDQETARILNNCTAKLGTAKFAVIEEFITPTLQSGFRRYIEYRANVCNVVRLRLLTTARVNHGSSEIKEVLPNENGVKCTREKFEMGKRHTKCSAMKLITNSPSMENSERIHRPAKRKSVHEQQNCDKGGGTEPEATIVLFDSSTSSPPQKKIQQRGKWNRLQGNQQLD
ncbi:hypothetical protein QAD02_011964 [Eretmocerus hayati]|uniref:Uncharacterized protein n=1 Tax=Eretmocerus hayati TaxID=131215 RepID=A0ACC2NY87_9HYME|nr:hypothetical protein QAD02_011964 [Eretmocerus hayati]